MEGVHVMVGVFVIVGVLVCVGVKVGVNVDVGVAVLVDVDVAVCVGVGVGGKIHSIGLTGPLQDTRMNRSGSTRAARRMYTLSLLCIQYPPYHNAAEYIVSPVKLSGSKVRINFSPGRNLFPSGRNYQPPDIPEEFRDEPCSPARLYRKCSQPATVQRTGEHTQESG